VLLQLVWIINNKERHRSRLWWISQTLCSTLCGIFPNLLRRVV
jgi:hypothetical protein